MNCSNLTIPVSSLKHLASLLVRVIFLPFMDLFIFSMAVMIST